jgi:hypothetical protein
MTMADSARLHFGEPTQPHPGIGDIPQKENFRARIPRKVGLETITIKSMSHK